ncbi:MAG: hypothetical protein A2138_08435 [Deltaproteobacteria bacterium RBG_16_71_12]|nr:MAG: hypothetical protein A2138_08435 [Deltaproteobacteria bacterium RBG_16_71_12]
MRCDAEGRSLDDDGNPVAGTNRAALPFHIAVNMMIPEVDLQSMAIQISPLGGSRGGSVERPIIIDDFMRIPNAAFIPALEGGPINIPPEFQVLAAFFSRPFDSNAYFQGYRDFAYDGDIVRHEFTHGIIHTLNPQLGSNGVDDWGSHVEPGAMNEGWSDFFSASYANDPEMGEYASDGLTEAGETGLRNNDNDKRCPESLIGEVHADSEPWAGALWSIRATLGGDAAKVAALERAALQAIAVSAPDEDFAAASAALVEAIAGESALGAGVADAAQAELDARGLSDCARILTLSTADADGAFAATPIAQLNQPGKSDVGLTNYAPALVQLAIQVPPGSGGFTLKWAQGSGGLEGVMGGGGDPEPMSVIVVEGEERIVWTYQGSGGSLATPTDASGAEIPFDAGATTSVATIGEPNQTTGLADASFTVTLESDPCNVRSFVAQVVSPAGGANLQNIDVENLATDSECEVEPPPGVDDCDCNHASGRGAPLALAALGVLGAFLRRRRA